MSTPKNTYYKQRQAEFRQLNKRFFSQRKGNLDQTGAPILEEIKFKEIESK